MSLERNLGFIGMVEFENGHGKIVLIQLRIKWGIELDFGII